ncbi:MAG: ParB/RepB/Spo0J family partition protein [Spirochaetaceae bacterium]|jgi:ParB family chromosome partitioning protein|nr:ParB/RepB/Spo0J family partition protein [Spirochaetaceae bacterium]
MRGRLSGLGKGLDALLPISSDKLPDSVSSGGQAAIPIDKISANPNQPRKNFSEAALDELAATIRKNGVLSPILVEKTGEDSFVVIAGERRLRAAKIAGLTEIPAIIKKFSPEESFLVSIIENLQREDLNPIEEAAAFKQLMEISGLNQDGVAARVGKSRAAVANAVRLLKLPPAVQEALKTGLVSPGHARALLSIENTVSRIALFQEIISSSLSVRETERRAAELAGRTNDFNNTHQENEIPPDSAITYVTNEESFEPDVMEPPVSNPQKKSGFELKDPELNALEEKFIKALGTKVKIEGSMENGTVKIEYFNADDLQRLCDIFLMQSSERT